MNQQTKDRLREYAARKRGVLLKDLAPWEIDVACDAAFDAGYGETDTRLLSDVRHLKYATFDQLRVFCRRLPCEIGWQTIPTGIRYVALFDRRALVAALRAMGLTDRNINKYIGQKDSCWRVLDTRESSECYRGREDG